MTDSCLGSKVRKVLHDSTTNQKPETAWWQSTELVQTQTISWPHSDQSSSLRSFRDQQQLSQALSNFRWEPCQPLLQIQASWSDFLYANVNPAETIAPFSIRIQSRPKPSWTLPKPAEESFPSASWSGLYEDSSWKVSHSWQLPSSSRSSFSKSSSEPPLNILVQVLSRLRVKERWRLKGLRSQDYPSAQERARWKLTYQKTNECVHDLGKGWKEEDSQELKAQIGASLDAPTVRAGMGANGIFFNALF